MGEGLRVRCVYFCEALHGHHTIEDTVVFPGLEREFPELVSAVRRLRHEHHVVAGILAELQALLGSAGSADVDRVRGEFERLAGELEAHLDYEESQLVPTLNSLTTLPWKQFD